MTSIGFLIGGGTHGYRELGVFIEKIGVFTGKVGAVTENVGGSTGYLEILEKFAMKSYTLHILKTRQIEVTCY